jgi:cytochrome c oxidase assembly protein subunit 15
MKWLHRFAILVVCSTVLLIAAGGMVTSTGSGLAVPDWPNTYGSFMFSFPLE